MIAITSQGKDLDSQINSRFGRCEYIIFYDQETKDYEAKENPSRHAAGGAGISTAQFLSDNNVKVLITGNVGPKAMRVLNAAEIKVFTKASNTVKEALVDYEKGKLKQTEEATTN
ncbi:NifB/NifX family molybdenum-iron cluster-binding protein [Natranaerobius trueperi]|uniref:Dinitrogenase iron-molybdenum cofactor biosynthesis protein n=1 Tax=Natranaerobius trueperi TaxID=759412 RepID=A0A226C0E7_9FIRM|nr:NifB/NifX family molybdenum-iron cluster-binding protein [Natranaerobius trueperi]OWZ83850.1 dinitrogenase iron-molybdenum cofactor biosynthesis protein [Natranaerobius trueperi]